MKNNNWFKDAIIYQIFIDRFAGFDEKNKDKWNEPDFVGGNIRGIIEKLTYLKNLGINTIWLSPFYKCQSYHGYDVVDFFSINPRFGTLNDLKELIKKAKEININIIADFVPNHCSAKHPFFIDAQKNRDSEYKNWFYFKKWPDDYLCFLEYKELPKLNLDYPSTRKYIVDAAKHWLKLGFAGFRLDHAIGPSHKFWKIFRREIKKDFPNSVLIGEVCIAGIKANQLKTINIKNKNLTLLRRNPDVLFKEYVGELDGVLDFQFYSFMRDFVCNKIKNKKFLIKKLKKHYSVFKDFYLPTFLDNHDVNRFLFECKQNVNKLKDAVEMQFLMKQPIIIYYGLEIGMTNERSIYEFKEYGDLQSRKSMDWENATESNELLHFYKRLIAERKMR